MTANGQGTEVDIEAAVHWYEAAADQAMAQAQIALAELFATGGGVERDLALARRWAEAAAASGHPAAPPLLLDLQRIAEGGVA